VRATAYVICGLLAALGGFVSVAQLGIINAGFGKGDEFDAIAAAVLGGTSLFGGVGGVFPGTVLGTVLIQMVSSGLVFTQVDLYLHPLISAAIIFWAVFLDSVRKEQLAKLSRRNIRTEAIN
jgi:ribose/xylose/arabinose/galactoside ABC-type transport system permease subunit